MSWVAVGVAGVGLVGGAIQSNSAKKAADQQSGAAGASTDLQRGIYNDTVDRNQPFVQGGTNAYNALLGRLGIGGTNGQLEGYGTLGKVPTAADVMATPGYQFGLDQGTNALNHKLAARGMNYSGAALKAASRYGNDYATTKYNEAFTRQQGADQQAFNQLSQTAQIGQASANNTASNGQAFGAAAGNNLQGAANAQGAATIASGNAYTNALNQGVSAYKNYNTPTTGGSSQGGPTQTYTDGGDYYGHADGGPIRGPGGPRDDAIPARLSNGEHVFDADSVTAIGGGDNELGQIELNKLRALLKGGRRAH